ncbi:unnamed protein product [Pneumocystis jirovecii]|uniref:Uncharacterized protein n=1 Tax=Pneumocystis jirovecii TaxID=42068 RepID=L0P8J4_PNEJI|nr:unnamed protein product [Pneumocystis jirovecii]CCJ30463.1 unnamed protein product [Pneumocystis jirovecii]
METEDLSYEQKKEFSLEEGVYRLRKQFLLQTDSYPAEKSNTNPLSINMEPMPKSDDFQPSPLKFSLPYKSESTQHESPLKDQTVKSTSENTDSKDTMESHSEKKDVSDDDFLSENLFHDLASFTQNTDVEELLPNPSYMQNSNILRKIKKPKNSIIKKNSSFISQIILHDNLAKFLTSKISKAIYIFSTVEKEFSWITISPQTQEELLSKIIFTKGYITCHDVNQFTSNTDHIDVVFGFSSSDIIWFDPTSIRYTRLNKHGVINPSSVNCIKWIPGSKNLFMAAHNNGALVIYHKEREKFNFIPKDDSSTNTSDSIKFKIHVSLLNSKNQKCNPVSYWELPNQSPTSFSFSPLSCHVAVVFSDGTLKIIDYKNERLLDIYHSWFGGLICVCWSYDEQYILTGGEDDLITIWSFSNKTIVARCQGHHSWVTGVAFDPWKCSKNYYRFGSVGADCQLLLWDFNVEALNLPKSMKNDSFLQNNVSSSKTLSKNHNIEKNNENKQFEPVDHPSIPHASVSILSPITSEVLHNQWLNGIKFFKKSIIVSGKKDHIQIWDRP